METNEEILARITGKTVEYMKANFVTFDQCIKAMEEVQRKEQVKCIKNSQIVRSPSSHCTESSDFDGGIIKHFQDDGNIDDEMGGIIKHFKD